MHPRRVCAGKAGVLLQVLSAEPPSVKADAYTRQGLARSRAVPMNESCPFRPHRRYSGAVE